MKFSVVTAFGLWGLVGYSAISFALASTSDLDSGIEKGNVLAAQSASYSIKDASMLFIPAGGEVKQLNNSVLQLTGVLYSTDETSSMALFSFGKSPAKAYRVGAKLPNGMQLLAVNKRQVLLKDTNGEELELELKKP